MTWVALRMGSSIWVWLLRLLALLGHSRAKARVAIREEGHHQVMSSEAEAVMWFHVSSLGELEQALPVMQAYRERHPRTAWLLTVYSPSAWHPLQEKLPEGWREGDVMAVLPDDQRRTWALWLAHLPLEGLALAKYDLWPHLLTACKRAGVPIHAFAVSPSGGRVSTPSLWRALATISVQDQDAAAAFNGLGMEGAVHVDGDPRVERVLSRAAQLSPAWRTWAEAAEAVVVAGSTWQEEERLLRSMEWHAQRRLVLVPHDVSPAHLAALDAQWDGVAVRWSQWSQMSSEEQLRWHVVVVDATGLLFDLYRMADVAAIGGGHGANGLHNVLEPASAGLPIVTGPRLGDFREAVALKSMGVLRSGSFVHDLETALSRPQESKASGEKGRRWLEDQEGASAGIVARW